MSFLCAVVFASATIASPLPKHSKQPASVAKYTNDFVRFNAHRQQNGIMLNWIFSDPNNVVSFVIERSYDGSYYETVTEVPVNSKNQYKDNAVYPGYLHYRIKALMYDGSSIYSTVEVVRIVRNG